MQLYRKHRPKKFSDVLGQTETVHALQQALREGNVPQAILFAGESGTGKTTLARILRKELQCGDEDYEEINAASSRGIDTVRTVEENAPLQPMFGKARVWVFDESHHLSRDAMTALLKVVEDPPDHAWFFFCTTDPEKMIEPLRNRCTRYNVKPLSFELIKSLLEKTAAAEKIQVAEKALRKIAEVADGSPRRALVLLEKVAKFKDEKLQIDCAQKADSKRTAFQLARALVWGKEGWPGIADIIKGIEETDWEGLRHLVLACASKEILKGDGGAHKAYLVSCAFSERWYDSGRDMLIRACWEVCSNV